MSASCAIKPIPEFGGELRTYKGVLQTFAAHCHDYYVVGKICDGKRKLNLNGSNKLLTQGDIILFNPGDVHSCTQVCNSPLVYNSLTLSKEFFDGASLRFPDPSDKFVKLLFERSLIFLEEGQVDEAADELTKIGSFLELESFNIPDGGTHDRLAAKLFASIKGHLAEPLNVCDFALSEGISPYALIRSYKRKFSITPTQHLLSLRFEAARDLLAKGTSVSDVAMELGFADQSHMTRVFKQRLGITPAAYQSMVQR